MNKYNELCYLIEQAETYEPGMEFINLQKVYSSIQTDCKNKCRTGRDAMCIHECNVDAAQQAIRQGASTLAKISQIPDPKKREKLRVRMMSQIDKMRDRERKLREKLEMERNKFRRMTTR